MRDHLQKYGTALCTEIMNIDAAEFERFLLLLKEAWRQDKQVFILGNGGSAGTANHFVCDFGKNAVREPGKRRFRILSLADNVERITAYGNDVDFSEIFRQQMINLLNLGDVVIAVSASGNSPNLVRACEYAKEQGASVVALAGMGGGAISRLADAKLVTEMREYEPIEDYHLIILHMVVCYFKEHPEFLKCGEWNVESGVIV